MSGINGMPPVNIKANNTINEYVSLKRWRPIIEKMDICNKTSIKYLCMFAQYRSDQIQLDNQTVTNLGETTLPTEIKEMANKLSEKLGRVKVKGENLYYNVIKNTLEYQLENNDFIVVQKANNEDYNNNLTNLEILSVFPTEFVNTVNPSFCRDSKLKKIK